MLFYFIIFISFHQDNKEFLQESIVKALGKDEIIVEWVDGTGSKFGKILSTDRTFKMQQRKPIITKQIVLTYAICVCFFVCFLIFAIGVSQQYENLIAVCLIV